MAIQQIRYDPYLVKVRELFRAMCGKELEVALTAEGAGVCNDAFFIRTVNYDNCMLPWVESVFDLAGASILEIGCGSGAADLALAHKCGKVEAFDIDPISINLARERAQFFAVKNVSYHLLDADWASPARIPEFRDRIRRQFDVVLLPAVLEHLRMDERLAVLETTWGMLRSGGIMVIYDTPNRLYAYDVHSFRLPFFNWLPDDLALLYASRSPRPEFPAALSNADNPMETLYRLGRGVSYHEFDISIGLSEFEVINDGYSHTLTHRSISDVFESVLLNAFERFSPQIPPGFSKQYLELVLRKKWHKISLIDRHLVRDEMLDGTKPALLVEGDAYLHYRLLHGKYRKLTLEVLKHPWSSVLLICDKDGTPFHREDLYSEYPVCEVLQIPLPGNIHEFQIRVTASERSLANQAWILGAGADM